MRNLDAHLTDIMKKNLMFKCLELMNKEKLRLFMWKDLRQYFYIKVDNDWDESKMTVFISQIKKDIGKYHENTIVSANFVQKKKLYGFDGGEEHTFILMKFQSEAAMRKVKNLWYTAGKKKGVYQKVLTPGGICM